MPLGNFEKFLKISIPLKFEVGELTTSLNMK